MSESPRALVPGACFIRTGRVLRAGNDQWFDHCPSDVLESDVWDCESDVRDCVSVESDRVVSGLAVDVLSVIVAGGSAVCAVVVLASDSCSVLCALVASCVSSGFTVCIPVVAPEAVVVTLLGKEKGRPVTNRPLSSWSRIPW